jgi:hypothetical protein
MCRCLTPTSLANPLASSSSLTTKYPSFIISLYSSPISPDTSGNLVVSMRPLTSRNAIRAVELTARFPRVHGSPIHIGDPVRSNPHVSSSLVPPVEDWDREYSFARLRRCCHDPRR